MDRCEAPFDLAIVGSGFSGSLLAMIARRLGLSVVLLEKFKHPRFVMGESSTPLANLLLEELANRYDLPQLLPLTKWGTWQKAHPELAVGLKRGFTFYHHRRSEPFAAAPDRSDQLLVAASPSDKIGDTHWYRSDFDHFLLREARAAGVNYLDEIVLSVPERCADEVRLTGERAGESVSIRARFLVDATGPRGFLHSALHIPEAPFPNLPGTQGLYSHFQDVRRLGDMGLNPSEEPPPYPVDDAAVHHIFEGGWIWVLRFNNEITSAGAAVTDAMARELQLEEGEPAWQRLLQRLPTVADQFAEAKPVFPFIHAPRLSFQSSQTVGERWALLPSAVGFVDPLLSTGFPLALLGIERLANALKEDWGTPRFQQRLETYARQTSEELLAAERLIAALYANMADFEVFTALSKLYFAAASFTETARRLGRPELAGSFLMHDHPRFGPECRSCTDEAMNSLTPAQKHSLIERIHRVIEPFDIAGLNDPSRRNWYPVSANDLMNSAVKLQADESELNRLLQRCGFSG